MAAATDPTLDSLKRILDSGEYETIAGVPVFDEHDEFDQHGAVVRRFGKAELTAIVEATNRRADQTGDLAPFGPGHTIDGAPETMQPPPWGYFANFRLGIFGPQKKPAILADMLVRKERKAEALTYPRRSIELWVKDNIIDWVALMRRTPERDLGLLTYSKDSGVQLSPGLAQPLYYDQFATRGGSRRPLAALLSPAGKLRYAMEAIPVDPTANPETQQTGAGGAPPCPQGVDPNFHAMFSACMQQFFPGGPAKYAAGPGFAGGGNATIPGGAVAPPKPPAMDDEKVRLQREEEMIRFSRMEAKVQELAAAKTRAECEAQIRGLMYEGCELDVSSELDTFARLSPADRTKRAEYIRRYHRKDPAGGGWVQLAQDTNRPRETSRDERNAAVRYASEHNCSYDEALKLTRGA